MTARRVVATALVAVSVGLGGSACSGSSSDNSGAVTNLDNVGPQIAKLQSEVDALRAEVRALREELATSTTTTSAPLR
jgi:outer membrane murein-binding lipoprotein Lpp